MAKKQKQKGGSSKKKGRNKLKCQRYRDFNVRLTNKRRKVKKHLKKHPNDKNALKSIQN